MELKKAVIEANINPVTKAERNNALSLVLVEILIRRTIQKTRKPGAEKNKEIKAIPIMSAVISLYILWTTDKDIPQSNPFIKDARSQIVKVLPVIFI